MPYDAGNHPIEPEVSESISSISASVYTELSGHSCTLKEDIGQCEERAQAEKGSPPIAVQHAEGRCTEVCTEYKRLIQIRPS